MDHRKRRKQKHNHANNRKREWLKQSGRQRSLEKNGTEMAAEVAAPVPNGSPLRENGQADRFVETTEAAGRAVGWAALALAIAAWFVWGILLGATSAVLGFIAYRQGSRSLGIWSITLGLIALLANLIFIPLFFPAV